MEQAYDHKSDMWALGVVLYELLCLRRPFDGPDMLSLAENICRLTFLRNLLNQSMFCNFSKSFASISFCRRPHSKVPNIYRPELRALTNALLSKDPRKRPSVHQVRF